MLVASCFFADKDGAGFDEAVKAEGVELGALVAGGAVGNQHKPMPEPFKFLQGAFGVGVKADVGRVRAVCFHEFVDTERRRSAALGQICQCRLDASRVVLRDEPEQHALIGATFPGKLTGEHAVAGTQVVAFLEERVIEVEGYEAALTAVYISSFIVLNTRIICLSLSTEPLGRHRPWRFGIVAAIVWGVGKYRLHVHGAP